MSGDSSIVVGGTLIGIAEDMLVNLKVYQSGDYLNVKMASEKGNCAITLFDMNGTAIKETDFIGETRIDISDLPSGVYLSSVQYKGVLKNEKIVIVK